ncbi:MAG TPA: hypothetical protein VGD35_17695 [Chitinophaga sp.]
MRKLFLSATALVVLFAACSKDDDNNNPDPGPGYFPALKLHQSTVSASDSLASVYDADYKLVKQVRFDGNGVYRGTDSMVYENGKITKVINIDKAGAKTLRATLAYNSAGKLEIVGWYFSGDDKLSNYDSIVYNADGRPAAFYWKNEQSQLSAKKVYTWDSKGNLAREVRVSYTNNVEQKDSGIVDYTYDDKVNFGAKQVEIFLTEPEGVGFAFSVNNVLGSVSRNTLYSPDNKSVYTAEYTYDQDGYPVSRKDHYKSYTGDQVTWSQEDAWWFHYTR